MDDTIISKKELLQLTGITYGQLYRWKRKNLIPEEWFIKKSSFTGQETYFLKHQIIERVERIMSLKDDCSLDALADAFSTATQKLQIQRNQLLGLEWINPDILQQYEDNLEEVLQFNDLLGLMICHESGAQRIPSRDEGGRLIAFLQSQETLMTSKAFHLYCLKKGCESIWLLTDSSVPLLMEKDVHIALSLSLQPYIEKLSKYAFSQS